MPGRPMSTNATSCSCPLPATATAVHLHEALDQRQPDAQSAGGAIVRVLRLHEQLEDARQHVAANADAGVLDANDDLVLAALDAERDGPAALRIFGRVVEQIRHH